MPHLSVTAVMDRTDDNDAIRDTLAAQAVAAVIPAQKNRKDPILHDSGQYQSRNQIKRFCHRLKRFRCIATRYDKLHWPWCME